MKKILLAILSLGSASFAHSQCTELFFSEIDEGSGNNKAFEVYNPTSSPISLSNYRIIRFSNGSTSPTDSLTLTGTVAAHDVWVVANGQTTSSPTSPACDPILQAMADQLGGVYPDPCYQNGDDALVLAKISPRTFVDIFGKIGEDPGTAWTDVFPYTDAAGTWLTANHSMIRKNAVTQGTTANPSAFNLLAEWDTLPSNTWTNLGLHSSTCGGTGIHEMTGNLFAVNTFPNPSNGTFTVNANSGIASVEIYNMLGEVVSSEKFADKNSTQQINMSSKPEGIYLLRVLLVNGSSVTSRISIR
jgi:hypothetical protein